MQPAPVRFIGPSPSRSRTPAAPASERLRPSQAPLRNERATGGPTIQRVCAGQSGGCTCGADSGVRLETAQTPSLSYSRHPGKDQTNAAEAPDGGPVAVPDAGPAAVPDGGPAAVPDGGPAAVPDGGPAAVPDGGPAAVPDGGPAAVPDGGPAAAPATVTSLTVTNQATAITYEEPGPGGPHFVTVAGRTGDENVLIQATVSRPLGPGESVAWSFDPPGGGFPDAAMPTRALVSRRMATRVRVQATSGGVSSALTVWAVFAEVSRVSGPTLTPILEPGQLDLSAPVEFDGEIFPRSLITSPNRPSFARPPVPPPGGANSCGSALAGGVNNRFDMSRQVQIAAVDPKGLFPECVNSPGPFPADNAEGNDDAGTADEKNNPFAGGIIPVNNRAVPAGFIGSHDAPGRPFPDAVGVAGDSIQIDLTFREFARLEYNRTWWLISHIAPWAVHFRARKNAANKWVNDGSSAV